MLTVFANLYQGFSNIQVKMKLEYLTCLVCHGQHNVAGVLVDG